MADGSNDASARLPMPPSPIVSPVLHLIIIIVSSVHLTTFVAPIDSIVSVRA